MDISTVRDKSYRGGKHWILLLDDTTCMCWSMILKKKSDLCEKMLELVLDLKTKLRITVKVILIDAIMLLKTRNLMKNAREGYSESNLSILQLKHHNRTECF